MAQIFLKMDGVEGGTTDPDSDYAGNFEVNSVNFGGAFNVDMKTFSPTGDAIANPVTVTINHDKQLGSIYDAWFLQKVQQVEIVWRVKREDAKHKAIEVKLTDAFISEVSTSCDDAAGSEVDVMNTLTFVYKSMEITAMDSGGTAGGTVAMDIRN